MISKAGHYEPVAREGLVFVIPLLLAALVGWWAGYPWISLFLLLASAAVGLFFRNPERVPPEGAGTILSPADGRVMEVVRQVRSENLQEFPLQRISIFMSIFNVHVNRWPASGRVRKITHVPGRFLDAREPSSSLVNEHNTVVVDAEDGAYEVIQIAGKVARRIACWVKEGDEAVRGQRFGLIRFGSRLDVILPEGFSFVVAAGTRVRAGETVIAEKNIQSARSPGSENKA